MKKQNWRGERGAIMLEGMIVMVITLFVLIWILGLGFVYYQRYITTVVTNDAATKIASTYNNIDSDIIMGYVNTEALTGRNLYRRFSADTLHGANEDRAAAYVRYILDKANFVGVVDSVDVELELVLDSVLRRHVELTTTCTYNTPFGEGLELFGMSGESLRRLHRLRGLHFHRGLWQRLGGRHLYRVRADWKHYKPAEHLREDL